MALFAAVLALGFALKMGGTPVFDPALSRIAAAGRAQGGFWLLLSRIGKGEVVACVALISAAALAYAGRRRNALIVALTVGAEMATNPLLKLLFARVRPALYTHLDQVFDLSYPSGHSAQNACLYLLLALFIRSRVALIGIPLAILIGLSRVVLGVHWPTDVIGGWMEGAAFALFAAHLQQPRLVSRGDS